MVTLEQYTEAMRAFILQRPGFEPADYTGSALPDNDEMACFGIYTNDGGEDDTDQQVFCEDFATVLDAMDAMRLELAKL